MKNDEYRLHRISGIGHQLFDLLRTPQDNKLRPQCLAEDEGAVSRGAGGAGGRLEWWDVPGGRAARVNCFGVIRVL